MMPIFWLFARLSGQHDFACAAMRSRLQVGVSTELGGAARMWSARQVKLQLGFGSIRAVWVEFGDTCVDSL